ncbi:Lrp/AsnC family transcriptional regulator [Oharaeibacter diazotrophicus]|uniref:AsnC family transcriptional regulator n=1 Tax=Oharaeibacter diazotrophicus TaxID=1920512 RepID=A0A4R6R5F0_9HYPH|nr:Lrp/AsnC family transcriptional regulator [Oharaeibacter diazotrophicus]TDP81113.1 AsnC family transcriptional regulator [Oharaeibacter diazotrophicus]BBE74893.1 leucine-responsive regulatory protein [Pleomorphomonas sp. SM30]GLS75602.1 AsnC family transcriptional regulator [Oharaeibacter diazotrophicus]
MALDEIDRRIIRRLRVDGRISNVDLARDVGLSPSACLRRLRTLEETGTIRGYTAIVAGEAGDGTVAIVRITLDRQTEESLDRFEAAIRRHPEIRECFLMTGDADYLLRVEARSAADYEVIHKEILSRLPGVARIQSSFAIRSVLTLPESRRGDG